MLYGNTSLKGYKLQGIDGEIGKVKDFYFDDQHWAIRYLVVDTGTWLDSRKVLISPYALLDVISEDHDIGVSLTMKQIEESPSLDTDAPVSRQFEASYYDYYGWPVYWEGSYAWGVYSYPYITGPYPRTPNSVPLPEKHNTGGKPWNPHLRSAHDLTGHHIHATDGEIGHVVDVLIDDQTWSIRYLIVSTHNWWPGKKVLVSPTWIERVSWGESKVFVDLTRDAIKQAPECSLEDGLMRDYELNLYRHYQREGYWLDQPQAAAMTSR